MIASLLLAAATAFSIRGGDFVAGGSVPKELMAADCGGQNHSPSLAWSGEPQGTKSFAILVHDADAPVSGGFYHWVLYDIPATQHAIDGNAAVPLHELGVASTGRQAYYGPCPPAGSPHHYAFTIYALDVRSAGGGEPLTAAALLERIAGHVLAQTAVHATAQSY
jgi:Raf kinase inhibitor-like YbhB/YbcL family protein